MMNTRTTSYLYVSAAAMILTWGLAEPAAAQSSCPAIAPGCFTGTFRGEDSHPVVPAVPTTVVLHTTAAGIGTHLNRFSLTRDVIGDLTNFTAHGAAQWTAADGEDIIYTTVFGQAELSDRNGGSLKVTEIHIITGGTGRFTGAQGSFTVQLFHKLQPSGVADGIEAHHISGSFHGSITYPGGAR
jgi:hypothetical protein